MNWSGTVLRHLSISNARRLLTKLANWQLLLTNALVLTTFEISLNTEKGVHWTVYFCCSSLSLLLLSLLCLYLWNLHVMGKPIFNLSIRSTSLFSYHTCKYHYGKNRTLDTSLLLMFEPVSFSLRGKCNYYYVSRHFIALTII